MKIKKTRERHGMRWTYIYMVWIQMKARCSNPRHKQYKFYGGRGVLVCDDWTSSFIQFFNDMGQEYVHGLDLDRVDNDLGYSKENCRWTTRNINVANRRNFGKYLKGVVGKTRGNKKFISRITINGKKISLGAYLLEIDAHNAFNKAHMAYYGF